MKKAKALITEYCYWNESQLHERAILAFSPLARNDALVFPFVCEALGR